MPRRPRCVGNRQLSRSRISEIAELFEHVAREPSARIGVRNSFSAACYAFHRDSTIRRWEYEGRDNFGPVRIPRDALFLMGDNRDNSNDSRYWGTLPAHDVLGRAHVIYWSWDGGRSKVRWERIGTQLN